MVASTPAKVTSAADWKKKSGKTAIPTPMPSGNTALIKIVGADVFFKQGLIPNSLKATVQDAITKGEAPNLEDFQKANEGNLEMIQDVIKLANVVTVESVIEPQVLLDTYTENDAALSLCQAEQVGQKIPEAVRDQAALYVDEVDFDDRLFILQLAFGGTRDLETFRKGLEGDVEPVPARKAAPKPTKRTGGSGKKR